MEYRSFHFEQSFFDTPLCIFHSFICPLLFLSSSMYAFSAFDNQQLQYLWDWKQHNLTIKTGKLYFRANPKLCMSEIRNMWDKTGIKGRFDESDFRNNGDRASCKGQMSFSLKTTKILIATSSTPVY